MLYENQRLIQSVGQPPMEDYRSQLKKIDGPMIDATVSPIIVPLLAAAAYSFARRAIRNAIKRKDIFKISDE